MSINIVRAANKEEKASGVIGGVTVGVFDTDVPIIEASSYNALEIEMARETTNRAMLSDAALVDALTKCLGAGTITAIRPTKKTVRGGDNEFWVWFSNRTPKEQSPEAKAKAHEAAERALERKRADYVNMRVALGVDSHAAAAEYDTGIQARKEQQAAAQAVLEQQQQLYAQMQEQMRTMQDEMLKLQRTLK